MNESEKNVKNITDLKLRQTNPIKGKFEVTAQTLNEFKKII